METAECAASRALVGAHECVFCSASRRAGGRGDVVALRVRVVNPPGRTRPFSARSVESSSPPCPHATQPVRLLPYWDVSAIFVLPSPSRRVCSAPRRRGSPSRTNTLRPGGARRDPRCESVGGARVPALSGTAAGAERAQIRPPRVKEGGSDTAKRCFRGPHELRAFIPSKIFIYPQFA